MLDQQKKTLKSWQPFSLACLTILLVCSLSWTCETAGDAAGTTFVDISDKVNLNFVHDPAVEGNYFMPESIGSGGAFLDYDNDGDLDIYLLNGAYHGTGDDELHLKNRLFRQDPGGTFVDVTGSSGLGDPGYGMGVAIGDLDNDGFVDVYVSNYGPDALYRNNGDGTFSNITSQAGIANPQWACSVTFLDFDRDSYLDIFVANYLNYDPAAVCLDRSGRRDYCGHGSFDGVPDKLYRNNGDGSFEDVSLSSNIGQVNSKSLGVVSADLDGDNYMDLYVANDGEANQLWMNQKNGTFQDRALAFGAALNEVGRAEAGMGVAIGDLDNDDDMDLFVTHLRTESNTLYRFNSAFGFQDNSAVSGLAGPSLPYTGFGAGFLDFDHDGDLDLAVANGRVTRGPLLIQAAAHDFWHDYSEPNLFFENLGDGKFQDISALTGFNQEIENSRGLAFGDVDQDGDLDILVTNEGGRARLLQNRAAAGHWLIVKAVDPALKRDAIGARISLRAQEERLTRIVQPTYSFLSSSDPRVHFGLGEATMIDEIRIVWPNGDLQTFTAVEVDQVVTLKKGDSNIYH